MQFKTDRRWRYFDRRTVFSYLDRSMGVGLSYSYVAVYLSVERFGVHPTYRLSVHLYLWSGVILIWRFFKRIYYTLFCDHILYHSEKYYTLEYIHGFYELKVYVDRTCDKCGVCNTLLISKHRGPVLMIKPMAKLLEEKGYKNAEDLA